MHIGSESNKCNRKIDIKPVSSEHVINSKPDKNDGLVPIMIVIFSKPNKVHTVQI